MQNGEADVMLAGGSEATITELGVAALLNESDEYPDITTILPDQVVADADRDGFVMGEGAGVLVPKTLDHAKARGAKIHCELIGYSASCDAFHITSPDVDSKGLAQCITNAISDAGIEAEDIDYINAHGTSTPYNDKFETNAVKGFWKSCLQSENEFH